jgi:hypothetical protein
VRGLQSSFSLYRLDFASELVFAGDAGTTFAGRPSRRTGVEFSNYYKPTDWLTVDADVAFAQARFRGFDPAGDHIPGAVEGVASIALAAYRHARLAGSDLTGTYHHLDDAVRAHDRTGLITAVLAELNQSTGLLEVISAGHPGGVVLRDGKAVTVLPTPTALPVSLGGRRTPVVIRESLQPGDRVLLYTDGIIEARDEDGTPFGLDRLVDFAGKALADQLPAAETVRRLVHAILAHQQDCLQDDATVLLVHWKGSP